MVMDMMMICFSEIIRQNPQMMSVTTDITLPANQTSSFIETSGIFNDTYRNYSGGGLGLHGKRSLYTSWWMNVDEYKYTYWSVVLSICLAGLTGNALVFVMMGDNKLTSLSYSVYLKFLAVSDSCLLIARLVNETEKTLLDGQLDEVKFCIVSFTVRFFFMILSPWLVVGLTFDRYVCVCFPLTRDLFCARKKAIIVCTTIVVVSIGTILPFPFKTTLVKGKCIAVEEIKYYFIFFRVLFCSFLPCLAILVLNILIIAQIRRSIVYRSNFTQSNRNQEDSSTRPLVLVSVFAFVTMLPVGLSEAVKSYFLLVKNNASSRILNSNIWTGLFIIYLLNFAQNFYILIASSTNYRQIIRRRLGCCEVKLNPARRMSHVTLSNIHVNLNGSGSEPTELSDISATPGITGSGMDGSFSDIVT